jgi:hypothetical protein
LRPGFLGVAILATALLPLSVVASAANSTRSNIEVKRQNTDHDTPGESTKTTLRLEALPEGPVALWRLDLPFPDESTSFSGSPFDPRLGDLKLRARLRPVETGGMQGELQGGLPLAFFSELTFPTADPESLGQGKYQVMLGMETTLPLASLSTDDHKLSFSPQIQQVVSVAGDAERKDINYTKLELALRDIWRKDYSLKLTAKPVIDWQQHGKTGAVAEIEGGVSFQHGWRTLLMLGWRLWGEDVPSTYGTRVELTLGRTF